MTNIKYSPKECSITFKGHSGYAEIGKDIVCAGISSLFFALYRSLHDRGIVSFADLNSSEGYAQIRAYPSAKERHTCVVMFETIITGLELMAQNYPDYVKIDKEEN